MAEHAAVTKIKVRPNGKIDVHVSNGFKPVLAPDLTHLAGPYLTAEQLAEVREALGRKAAPGTRLAAVTAALYPGYL